MELKGGKAAFVGAAGAETRNPTRSPDRIARAGRKVGPTSSNDPIREKLHV